MLALPNKDFKAAIGAVFPDVNVLEINRKLGVPSTEREAKGKSQMEITELKTRRSIIKNSQGHRNSRGEMTEEKSVNLKINRNDPI